jgi:hypothetical protein
MCHVLFGSALGSVLILFSLLLGAEMKIVLEYYFLIVCFGSASSVIYGWMIR